MRRPGFRYGWSMNSAAIQQERDIAQLRGLDRAIYALFFSARVPRGWSLTYDRIAVAINREPRSVSSACGRLVGDGILEVREARRTSRATAGGTYGIPERLKNSPPPPPPTLSLFDLSRSWMSGINPEDELRRQVERALWVIAVNGQRTWIAAKEAYEYVASWDAGMRQPFGEKYKITTKASPDTADIFETDVAPDAQPADTLGMDAFSFLPSVAPFQRDSHTSKRAAERTRPRIAGYQVRAYRAISENPGRTRTEIGAITGMWMSTLTPRIRELAQDGLVEERGTWVNPVTGKANGLLYPTGLSVVLGDDKEGVGEEDCLYAVRRAAIADIRAEIERNLARDLAGTAALVIARARENREHELAVALG